MPISAANPAWPQSRSIRPWCVHRPRCSRPWPSSRTRTREWRSSRRATAARAHQLTLAQFGSNGVGYNHFVAARGRLDHQCVSDLDRAVVDRRVRDQQQRIVKAAQVRHQQFDLTQRTRAMSSNCHVLSKRGFVGPYARNITSKVPPDLVGIQFLARRAGAFGPK